MAFDDILKKIQADGAEAAAAVAAEADTAIGNIHHEGQRAAEAMRSQLHTRATRRATEHEERLVILAQLEHRKAALAEKQRALGTAFAAAQDRLEHLPAGDARSLLKRIILERVETGREELVIGREHAAVADHAFLADLNGTLQERGHLRLASEPGDFPHGVVLREGRKEINLRLPVLMAEAREQFVHHVAQQLFPAETPTNG